MRQLCRLLDLFADGFGDCEHVDACVKDLEERSQQVGWQLGAGFVCAD